MVTTVISNIIISMLYSRLKSFHMNCAVIYGEQNLKSDSFRAVFYCGLTKKKIFTCYIMPMSYIVSQGSLFMTILFIFGVTYKIGGKDHLCMET